MIKISNYIVCYTLIKEPLPITAVAGTTPWTLSKVSLFAYYATTVFCVFAVAVKHLVRYIFADLECL